MTPKTSATKRRPDWILTCKRKDAPRGTHATKFGAGWVNQFGGINITIDRGCKFPDPALYWVSMQENEYADVDVEAPPTRQANLSEERWAPRAKPQEPPSPPPPVDDYMERRRQERVAKAKQPPPPLDDGQPDAPAPEDDPPWLA